MEICEFALSILNGKNLSEKLFFPKESFTDSGSTHPLRIELPERAESLKVAPPELRKKVKLPKPASMGSIENRAKALHYFANHELLAIELMAWALLAFPQTPLEFKLGTLSVLKDEQKHFRLYQVRMKELSKVEFGDYPLNDFFWKHVSKVETPLQFVSAMALTFEGANLDFAEEYESELIKIGDLKTAEILNTIQVDETRHVAHGWKWFKHWTVPESAEDEFEAYKRNLEFPLKPERAKGRLFSRRARLEAGLSEKFVNKLEKI